MIFEKTLIKFDNVLNDQRHVIFSQRKEAMNSNDIFSFSEIFLEEIIEDLIKLKILKSSNPKNVEFDNKLKTILSKNLAEDELKELILSSDKKFREKISKKFEDARNERTKILGKGQSQEVEKRILLQSIDINWKSHIQYLEQLRQVIGLRSYGQRDPLVEYKKEAFDLFSNLLIKLKLDFIDFNELKVIEETKQNDDTREKKLTQN